MRKRKTDYRPVYQAMAMISQFGINMLVPIGLMTVLGMWLDEKLGTSYLVVALFFVGAAAGFRNIYIAAKQLFKKHPSEVNSKDSE